MPGGPGGALLDASALLAYLQDEEGADVVAGSIAAGARICTVNLAEVLSSLAVHGVDPADAVRQMTDRGLLAGAIAIEPFTTADAAEAARLRPLTRGAGLSLADRSCLAVALRLDVPALTADRAWAEVDVGVETIVVR